MYTYLYLNISSFRIFRSLCKISRRWEVAETAAYQSVAAKLIKLVPIVSVKGGWPGLPPHASILHSAHPPSLTSIYYCFCPKHFDCFACTACLLNFIFVPVPMPIFNFPTLKFAACVSVCAGG